MVWLMIVLGCSAGAHAGEPAPARIAFTVEPHLATVTQSDEALEDYGFAPVGSPLLPTWGLRARIDHPSGLTVGAAMSYGFTLSRAEATPVPTTTTAARLGSHLGYRPTAWLEVGGDLGFAALTHQVGSEVQGGALTYLGPYAAPRATARLLDGPATLEVALGWSLHLPLGPAHRQPLWEEGFSRTLIHGPLAALQLGFSNLGADP